MTITMTEQAILDNVPEGAMLTCTICEDKQRLYIDNLRMLANGCATFWNVYGKEFDPDGRYMSFNDDLRSLSDIKRIAYLEEVHKTQSEKIITLDKRIAKLEDSLETERCRLAACGVVANANTRETAATQRVMHEDYKSASLLDVIRAVDTEIEQRERIAELEEQLQAAQPEYSKELFNKYAAYVHTCRIMRTEPKFDEWLAEQGVKPSQPKWISVEDRLPITEQDMIDDNKNYNTVEVICFDKIGGHTVYIDDFEAGNTINFWCKFASTSPTHWMPLPAPPEKE